MFRSKKEMPAIKAPHLKIALAPKAEHARIGIVTYPPVWSFFDFLWSFFDFFFSCSSVNFFTFMFPFLPFIFFSGINSLTYHSRIIQIVRQVDHLDDCSSPFDLATSRCSFWASFS